jgi:hypothetical protein
VQASAKSHAKLRQCKRTFKDKQFGLLSHLLEIEWSAVNTAPSELPLHLVQCLPLNK